jgi:hypothetical protein
MGKTALAMNIVQNLTMDPLQARAASVFNLEMSAESLLLRMACAVSRVDQHKMRLGFLNKEERYRLRDAQPDPCGLMMLGKQKAYKVGEAAKYNLPGQGFGQM